MFNFLAVAYAIGAVITFAVLLKYEGKDFNLGIAFMLSILWPMSWIVALFIK